MGEHKNIQRSIYFQNVKALFNLTDDKGEERLLKTEVISTSNLVLVSLSHIGNARVPTYYQVLDRDHERMCLQRAR